MVVALAKSGDVQAFAELVKRRQAWLRNVLRRLCGDANLADDLAQQALLKAWRSIGNLKANLAFGSWLRQLAVNAWVDHLRRHEPLDAVATDEAPEQAAPATQWTAEGIDLQRALATLPAAVRLCIVLAYGEGMAHSEVSAATGFALGTVKSHLSRGLERLQKILKT
jgi:RNA polymerase sigma factor (sigma-70 family)